VFKSPVSIPTEAQRSGGISENIRDFSYRRNGIARLLEKKIVDREYMVNWFVVKPSPFAQCGGGLFKKEKNG
jgi:hypothetical protein